MTTTQAKRLRTGTRVKYNASPASDALNHSRYHNPPALGVEGVVTPVSFGSCRKTFLPGPGGGLVYVKWAPGTPSEFTMGVSALDVDRA